MELRSHHAGKENIPPDKVGQLRVRCQRRTSSSSDEEILLARRARKLKFLRDHVFNHRTENGNSSSDCMPRSSSSSSTDHLSPKASLFEGKGGVPLFPSQSSSKLSPQNTLPHSGTPGSRDAGRQLVSGRLKTRPARRRRLKTLKNGAPLRYLATSNTSSTTEQEEQISPSEIPNRDKLKSFFSESSECKISGCLNPWEQVLALETPHKQSLHSEIFSIFKEKVDAPKKRVAEHKISEKQDRSHLAKKRLIFQTPNKRDLFGQTQGPHTSNNGQKMLSKSSSKQKIFPGMSTDRFCVPETTVKQLSKDTKDKLEQHTPLEKEVLPSTSSIHIKDEKAMKQLLQNGVLSNMNSETPLKEKTPSAGYTKKEKTSKIQVLPSKSSKKQILQSNTTTPSETVRLNDLQTNALLHHGNENVLQEQFLDKSKIYSESLNSPQLIPLEASKVGENTENIFWLKANTKHQSDKSKKEEMLHAAFSKNGSTSEISNKQVLKRTEKQASTSKSSEKIQKTHKASNAELKRFSENKKQEVLSEKHLHSNAPPKKEEQVNRKSKKRLCSLETSKKKMNVHETPNKDLCSSNFLNQKISLPSVTIRFMSSRESVENQRTSYEAARDLGSSKANMTPKADKNHLASVKTFKTHASSSTTNKKQISSTGDIRRHVSPAEDVKERASRSETVKDPVPAQDNVKKRATRSKAVKEKAPTQDTVRKRPSLLETVNKNVSESNLSKEQVPSTSTPVRSNSDVFAKIPNDKLKPYIRLQRLPLPGKTPVEKWSVNKPESGLSPKNRKKLFTKQVFSKQNAISQNVNMHTCTTAISPNFGVAEQNQKAKAILGQNANIPIVNNLTENVKLPISNKGQSTPLKRYKGPNRNSDAFHSCMHVRTPEIHDKLTEPYVVSAFKQEVASEDEKTFRKIENNYSSTPPSQEVSSEGSAELYYTLDGEKSDMSEAFQAKGHSNTRFGAHLGNPMVQIYYGAVKYLPAYSLPSKWKVRQKKHESSLRCSPGNKINTYTNNSIDPKGHEIQHMVNNGISKENFGEAIRIPKGIGRTGDEQQRKGKEEPVKRLLNLNVCNKETTDITETKECRREAAEKSSNSKVHMDHKPNAEKSKRIIKDKKETQGNGDIRKSSKTIGSRVKQGDMHNVEKSEEEEGINCTTKKETSKLKKTMEACINFVSKFSDQDVKASEDKVELKMVNVEKSHCAKKKKAKTSKKNKAPGECVECKLLGEVSQVTDVNNASDRNDNSIINKKILEVEINSLVHNLPKDCSVTEEICSQKKKKGMPSTSKKKTEKTEEDKLIENALKDKICREVAKSGGGKEVSRGISEQETRTRIVNNVSLTKTVISPFNIDIKDSRSLVNNSKTTSSGMDNVQRVIEDVVANFQPQCSLFSDKKTMEAAINFVSKLSDQNIKVSEDKVELKIANVEKSHCTKKKKAKTSKKNKDPGECKLIGEVSQVTDVNNTSDRNDNSIINNKILEVEINSLVNNLPKVCSVTEEICSQKKKKSMPSTEKVEEDKLIANALKDNVCRELVRSGGGREVSRGISEQETRTRIVNNVSFTETVISPFNIDIKDSRSLVDNSKTTSSSMDNVQRVIEDVVANFQPQFSLFSDKMKDVTEIIETVVAESKTYRNESLECSPMHTTNKKKGDGSTRAKQVKDITDNVNTESKSPEHVSNVESEKEIQSETVEEDPRTILSYLPNLAKALDRRASEGPERNTLFGLSIGNELRESKFDPGIFTMSQDDDLTYPALLHEVGHSSFVPKRKSNIGFADILIKKLKIDTENDSCSSPDSDETSNRGISESQNHLQINSGNSLSGCKSPIQNFEKENDVSTASVPDKTSETPADNNKNIHKCYREIQEADSSTALVPPTAPSTTATALTKTLNEASPWELFFLEEKLDLEDFDQSSFFRSYATKVKYQKSKNTAKSARKRIRKSEGTGNWLQRPKENVKV